MTRTASYLLAGARARVAVTGRMRATGRPVAPITPGMSAPALMPLVGPMVRWMAAREWMPRPTGVQSWSAPRYDHLDVPRRL